MADRTTVPDQVKKLRGPDVLETVVSAFGAYVSTGTLPLLQPRTPQMAEVVKSHS